MKNADMPAMPLTGDAYTDFAAYDETVNTSYNPQCQGLTKREHFAAMAMQGLLSGGYDNNRASLSNVAVESVAIAEQLIEELDRTK